MGCSDNEFLWLKPVHFMDYEWIFSERYSSSFSLILRLMFYILFNERLATNLKLHSINEYKNYLKVNGIYLNKRKDHILCRLKLEDSCRDYSHFDLQFGQPVYQIYHFLNLQHLGKFLLSVLFISVDTFYLF